MKIKSVSALMALGLACLPSISSAQTTNVVSWNLDNNGTVGDTGGGTSPNRAGIVLVSNWNNSFSANPTVNIRANSGNPTKLDLSYQSSSGSWNHGGTPGQDADGSYNRNLLNGYLNSGSPNSSIFTVSEVPYTQYDVYVYFGADVAGRTGTISDGTTTYSLSTVGPNSVTNANAVFAQTTDTGAGNPTANYCVFTGKTSSSLSVTCSIPSFGGIAGFQVVNTGPLAPSLTAVASPAAPTLNQSFTITATVTPGGGSVTNVTVDLSAIGLTNAASLVVSNGNVWTNTFTVPGSQTPGVKNLQLFATDNSPVSGGYNLSLTVAATDYVWDGGSGANDNWTSGVNWVGDTAPPTNGASAIMAGTTRPTPNVDTNYNLGSLTFSNTVNFTVGSGNGSVLSISSGLNNNSSTTNTLTVPITPFTGSVAVNAGTLAIGGAAQWGGGAYGGAIAIAGGSTLNYNSSSNQTFSGLISGSGTLQQTGPGQLTVSGRNTNFTGAVIVNGGTLYANPGNAAINGAFSFVSGITVNSGATLRSGANGLFGWDGTQTKPITVNAGGTLTTSTNIDVDVTLGTVTLNGGTISGFANAGGWGSFGFGRSATGRIIVTEDSTITATNIVLRHGDVVYGTVSNINNYIDVTAGKTLTISGTIGNYNDGPSKLVLSNGTGTVLLTGNNTYTDGTIIQSGTLQVGAGGTSGRIGGDVVNNATFIVNSSTNINLGTVNGTGTAMTKQGSGKLTLSGNVTLASATVAVQGGELGFSAPSGSCNNLTLSSGATNTLNKTDGSGNTTVFSTYTLNNNVLNLNFGAASGFPDHFIFATTLSASGVTTINITGTGLGTGVKNLILFGTGPAGLANFVLGTQPAGVTGVLTNTGSGIAYNITSSGKTLTWNGWDEVSTLLPVWSVGGSTNWHDTIGGTNAQYAVGDNVSFGDYHLGNGATNIILNTSVIPSSMVVNSALYDYTITGSGSIGGGVTLIKSNAAALTLGTSNTYTGGTLINGGTLSISNNNALGNTAGSVGLGGGTLRLAAGVTNARAINLTANSTISTATNTSSTLNGLISGTGGITKAGNGTLTVTNYNATSGNLLINTGTMVFGGTVKPGTDILIADGSGSATVNQATGEAATGVNNWAVVGRGGSAVGVFNLTGSSSFSSARLIVGQNTATGTVSMASGTLLTNNFNGNWWENYSLGFGVDNNGLGTFNMSGGSVKSSHVWVGGWGGKGEWNQTGGTADVTGNYWVGVMQDNDGAQPNGAVGTAIISNATVNAGNVAVGLGGAGAGANPTALASSRVKGDMTVANGGVVNSENDLQVGRSGSGSTGWGSYGTLNINSGGIVNVGSTITRWVTLGRYNSIDATVNVNSGGTLNLNAGTDMQINEGNNTGIRVVNVAGTIQGTTNGSYIDLNRNATAGGTTTFNITNGGLVVVDAILGKTNCTLNFYNGTLKATASDPNFIGAGTTVNINAGGATLDSNGNNPTVPADLTGPGGVTKIGAGTLYMNGTNTYAGTTTVNAGGLGGTGIISGPVVMGASSTLAAGASIGTLTISNNLNFAGGVLAEVNNTNAQTSDLTVVSGGLTNTGSGTVTVTNLGPALAVGNTFTLFSKPVVGGGSLVISGPAGVTWTNELATLGQIRVLTASSTPSPTLLTNSYNGTNLTLSWPAGQGWRLQQQITNRAVGLNTNWTAITDSSVSSTNITPDKSNGTVFYRLINP